MSNEPEYDPALSHRRPLSPDVLAAAASMGTAGQPLPNILRYFDFTHLPAHLQAVSMPFSELAHRLNTMLPPGPETTVALRKLLESKDAAVRAALDLPRGD